jgi:hypothetical protein
MRITSEVYVARSIFMIAAALEKIAGGPRSPVAFASIARGFVKRPEGVTGTDGDEDGMRALAKAREDSKKSLDVAGIYSKWNKPAPKQD